MWTINKYPRTHRILCCCRCCRLCVHVNECECEGQFNACMEKRWIDSVCLAMHANKEKTHLRIWQIGYENDAEPLPMVAKTMESFKSSIAKIVYHSIRLHHTRSLARSLIRSLAHSDNALAATAIPGTQIRQSNEPTTTIHDAVLTIQIHSTQINETVRHVQRARRRWRWRWQLFHFHSIVR